MEVEHHELVITTQDTLKAIVENSVKAAITEKFESINLKPLNDILSIQEASELLYLSKSTIYSLTSSSKIPFSKRGKKLYFNRKELIKWIEDGKPNP